MATGSMTPPLAVGVQEVPSLDQPQPQGPRMVVLVVSAAVATGLVLLGILLGDTELAAVPAVVLAHSWSMGLVTGLTAYILFGHAQATAIRGYLVLACGYLFVCALVLARILVAPSAVVEGEQPLGWASSSPWVFVLWRLAFPASIGLAAWVFHRDHRLNRPPGLPVTPRVAALITLGIAAAVFLVTLRPGLLPDLVSSQVLGQVEPLFAVLLRATAVVAVAALAMTALNLPQHSVMSLWLFGAALMTTVDAIVSLTATQRFMFGWYLELVIILFASTTLLFGLVWQLTRVDRELSRLASSDSLTGTLSRLALFGRVDEAIERLGVGAKVALLWIDLDRFKAVNDEFGHGVGDSVLRELALRLGEQCARHGTELGRVGGDEFATWLVLEPDERDRGRVDDLAEDLLRAATKPISFETLDVVLSCTIGVAVTPGDAGSAPELARRADEAMYIGKRAGGDQLVRFRPEFALSVEQEARTRRRLATALSEHEFTLHFQPIVTAVEGTTWGAEALLRWHNGDHLVTAADFIPAATRSGQIRAIGRQVVELLLAAVEPSRAGLSQDIRWAVNLSVPELEERDMAHLLLRGPFGEHPELLVVEVTESVALNPGSLAESHLAELRDAGATVAIDDFGTGHANFASLERLRPGILKIDRSFVERAAHRDPRADTFIAAAASIAASMDCRVVAEGIESDTHAAAVRRSGVDLLQGYHIARPMPIENLMEFVATSIPAADLRS